MIISRSLRSRVRSFVRNMLRASCWVIVLPPWRMPPAFLFSMAALPIDSRFIPLWVRKRESSAAITALRSHGEIRCRGVSTLSSMKNLAKGSLCAS